MGNLFRPTLLEWWQMGILKFALVSVGVLLVIYFPKFFKKYKSMWWLIAIVGTVYLLFVWFSQK